MFSPNNDGIDDIWEVNNIENYPDCKISVFNLQGRNVYEASPYLNNWDGNDTQGKPLLEGVYYYTIRCNGNKKNETTGSITLIR
jgi:gliding motility-associated-like protein